MEKPGDAPGLAINIYEPLQKLQLPKLIDLSRDLKKERDVVVYNTLVKDPMYRFVAEFEGNVKKYSLIKECGGSSHSF